MSIEAALFDLDGLLVDSEPVWFRARRALCARHGVEWTMHDHRQQMGVDTETWVGYMHRHLDGALPADEIERAMIRQMASSYRGGDVPKRPGADEAIALCAQRYRMALASGSPRLLIDAALAGGGWTHYFEQILSSDQVERGKPSPDVYIEAMRRMGVDPSRTIVLEDSAGGIRAGAAAGCHVIAVPDPEAMPADEVLALAATLLQSLEQLEGALQALNATPAPSP